MVWTQKQIEQHKKVSKILIKIKDLAFDYLRSHPICTEYEVQQFILEQFKEQGLVNEKDVPIVAFGKNTSQVHYFPTQDCATFSDECLVLIDIWARLDELGAPYADITWMGYKGENMPSEFLDAFNFVIKARDNCLNFINGELEKNNFPKCDAIHQNVCDFFSNYLLNENFLHGTGHSLGVNDPHGKHPRLNEKSKEELTLQNLGYSIEPGLYFKNNFGVRSEINFYINSEGKIIVTTPLQREVILI